MKWERGTTERERAESRGGREVAIRIETVIIELLTWTVAGTCSTPVKTTSRQVGVLQRVFHLAHDAEQLPESSRKDFIVSSPGKFSRISHLKFIVEYFFLQCHFTRIPSDPISSAHSCSFSFSLMFSTAERHKSHDRNFHLLLQSSHLSSPTLTLYFSYPSLWSFTSHMLPQRTWLA